MDTSNDITRNDWVDEQLSTLPLDPQWQPDPASALNTLRTRQTHRAFRRRRWTRGLAAVVVLGVCLPAMSMTRTFAARCVDACVDLTTRVTKALRPARTSDAAVAGERILAPEFSLPDARGAHVSLASLRGRVVLVNFWATWCAPCRVEMPWFVDLQHRHDDDGLSIVGISVDEDGWTSVRPYAAAHSIDYRLAIDTDAVAQTYDVDALPATFLIDRNGRVAFAHRGLVPRQTYEQEISALLSER
jgi:cytochrome c biogenesis protein CcmG/thiol:disulfide interchange protein DsbE